MIRLAEVDETLFFDVRGLDVEPNQRRFLDSPLGILARGYAYRAQRARVLAVLHDGVAVGVVLVKDMDEEPACYDLQQFMIDRRFQGGGAAASAGRLAAGEEVCRCRGLRPSGERCRLGSVCGCRFCRHRLCGSGRAGLPESDVQAVVPKKRSASHHKRGVFLRPYLQRLGLSV